MSTYCVPNDRGEWYREWGNRMPEKQIQEQKGIWWIREGGRAEWC